MIEAPLLALPQRCTAVATVNGIKYRNVTRLMDRHRNVCNLTAAKDAAGGFNRQPM